MNSDDRLRSLPSVDELSAAIVGVPRVVAVTAARDEIASARSEILAGREPDLDLLAESAALRARRRAAGSLKRVINATGVIIHTNLGRAPLAREAAAAAATLAAGYSNLEYDLERGQRASRQDHLSELLAELSGTQAAIAVNNNAAAVMLALAATAADREVIVSRGQLVEIGGSFRVPEILELSGARLVEVGTTNRTRIEDYEAAIRDDTAALLRVHQSNFRTVGFVEEVTLAALCRLARSHGLAVIDDLGSGAFETIADEPKVSDSVAAGADMICFSADKLLGGPQAGIVCGTGVAIRRCGAHPLARAVRLDKLQLTALEATLRLHRDRGAGSIPVLAMLDATNAELGRRAGVVADLIGPAARVATAASRPGGGSLPLLELPGPVCEVDPGPLGPDGLSKRLRLADPPIVARVARGAVVLDPRTMSDEEARIAGTATREALG
jgi:L-seryl-tRNA(Ser) seleniumtransferase